MRRRWIHGMRVSSLLTAFIVFLAGCATTQKIPPATQTPSSGTETKKPTTVEEIANYRGSDRTEILVEGAKKEGTLNLYSAMNAKDSKPVSDAFLKKYPFMKINLYAATGEEVTTRIVTEQKNRNYSADVFDCPTLCFEQVVRESFMSTFSTPEADSYAKDQVDPKHRWIPMYHNILTVVYNTKEVKDPPKTYDDLLDPRFKNKMAIETTDSAWLANLWQLWGEQKARDFFTKLGQQGMTTVQGHSVMAQRIVTGEIPLTPTQYLHQAISLKKSGAPIDFVLLDPMISLPEAVGIVKKAPHPHASMLWIDFVASKEGQMVINSLGRNVPYPGMDEFVSKAKLRMDDSPNTVEKLASWDKLYDQLLLAPNKKK